MLLIDERLINMQIYKIFFKTKNELNQEQKLYLIKNTG